jgi:hypothetical protein
VGVVPATHRTVAPNPPTAPTADFDAFTAAVVLAVLSGTLALVDSNLLALTGALGAIAVAAWVTRRVPHVRWARPNLPLALALTTLGTGAAVFLVGGARFPFRGVILGASLVPLWWAERHASHDRLPGLRERG